jgi:SET domain-containing protein
MPLRPYRARTWRDARQEFRTSPTHGIGSFARAPIAAGEVVEIVGGVVMSDDEFRAFQRTAARYNAIQIAEDRHLVERLEVTARRAGGSLNHSCDSNLWLADAVTLVARRDIAPGEELTVDYALFTAQPAWRLEHPCQCGAPVCRRTITGDDWRLPAVQARYYPHFSPFLNRRIERLGMRSKKENTA